MVESKPIPVKFKSLVRDRLRVLKCNENRKKDSKFETRSQSCVLSNTFFFFTKILERSNRGIADTLLFNAFRFLIWKNCPYGHQFLYRYTSKLKVNILTEIRIWNVSVKILICFQLENIGFNSALGGINWSNFSEFVNETRTRSIQWRFSA